MTITKVTFDSNVWEKMVLGEESFVEVKNLISQGRIEPYICEIAISLESIQKAQRLPFWKKYKTKCERVKEDIVGDRFHNTVCFGPDNEAHPGLHPKLKKCLLEAYSLGFKVLPMTNFGTVRCPEIPDDMKVGFNSIDDFWFYADRLSQCSDYIEALGAGGKQYFALKEEFDLNDETFFQNLQTYNKSELKRFHKAIAEWADGDSISAHYAYRNDYFCSLDQGKGAGSRSVFYPENLEKVSNEFDIKVVSVAELSIFSH